VNGTYRSVTSSYIHSTPSSKVGGDSKGLN
jgi:hypothetical protein